MRNNLMFFSAFTLAATLTLGGTDAEAKKPTKVNKIQSGPTAYDINTKDCNFPPREAPKTWPWINARLTALFIRQPDGSYKIEELPGAKNPDVKLPIASVAKLQTAHVILNLVDQGKLNLDKMIPVTKESLCLRKEDNGFAVKGLPAGITEINGHHAMGQMIKKSSNTMARNLAVAGAGSVENFVGLMNKTAKSYGMKDTQFVNPDGLPEGDRKEEYTTARDMMVLAMHILPQMERLKKYEMAPLQTWTLPEEKHWGKEELSRLGAIFKTGTIDQCANLLTIVPQGDNVVVDVQLCGTTKTRYQIAIQNIKTAFNQIGKLIMPSAPVAQTSALQAVPVKETTEPVSLPTSNFEPVSLRQVQPSMR